MPQCRVLITEVVATAAGVDLSLPRAVVDGQLPLVLQLPGVVSAYCLTDRCHHAHLQLREVGQKIVVRHPVIAAVLLERLSVNAEK